MPSSSSSMGCDPSCFLLTEEELTDFIAAGGIILGGPFDTEDECLVTCGSTSSSSSGSSTISTGCCAAVPSVLCMTVSGTTCDGNYTLTWDGSVSWNNFDDVGSCINDGHHPTFTLTCGGDFSNMWFLSVIGDLWPGDAVANSCDPFVVSFGPGFSADFAGCGCTSGPVTMVITPSCTIDMGCCNDLPPVLHATISGGGSCDGTYTLAWNGTKYATYEAIGSCSDCSGKPTLDFWCSNLEICGGGYPDQITINSCSPFDATALWPSSDCGCAGATLHIYE